MTDVDNLQGQALVDAVAVEVMGWVRWAVTIFEPELREQDCVDWWAEADIPDCDSRDRGEKLIRLVARWQPLSSWSDFGMVAERMGSLGLRLALHGNPGSAFLETGLRAALKAVRAKEATS